MKEARKYPRYQAKSGVLAVIHLPQRMVMTTGQVVDLGKGGIGFVYTGTEAPYTGPAELEVYGFELPEYSIGRIRCRVVYEITISRDPETGMEERRGGLEFPQSIRDIPDKLRAFIRSNTKVTE